MLGEKGVQVFVRLALDDETTETKRVVALDDRVFEILRETLRDVRNRQPRKVAAEAIDFGVQRVPTISACREEPLGLGIERGGTRPGLDPRQLVRILEETIGITNLLSERGVTANRRDYHQDDLADRPNGTARHDLSLSSPGPFQ